MKHTSMVNQEGIHTTSHVSLLEPRSSTSRQPEVIHRLEASPFSRTVSRADFKQILAGYFCSYWVILFNKH